jgi:uncharacterized membrane protein YccC
MADVEKKTAVWLAILRALRVVVAAGFPYFISWVLQNPDPRWSALGPIINGIAKYLRDVYKWEWLPV